MDTRLVTPWDILNAITDRRISISDGMARLRVDYPRLVVAMLDVGHLMPAALVDEGGVTTGFQKLVQSGLQRAQVEAIGAFAERLADATRALAVYLHGDRARGDARDDDPWELLVVLPADVEPGRWTPVTLWALVADAPMSIEVRAVTVATFAADRDDPNAVSADAARNGLRLYARHPKLGPAPTEEEIEAEAVEICRRAARRPDA